MGTREFSFIVGPETSTLPTQSDPSVAGDFVTLSYADDKYARRDSWYDMAADVATVKAIGTADRANGQVIWVMSLTKLFYFDSGSSAAGDDVTVIQPTTGTGRWLQIVPPSAGSEYDRVVANPAVTGFSTDTTIGSAITAASNGYQILITRATYSENLTINKRLRIKGVGRDAIISGNVTFASGSSYSHLSNVKITGTVTFNSGVIGCRVAEGVFVPSTFTSVTDSNPASAGPRPNFFQAMRED